MDITTTIANQIRDHFHELHTLLLDSFTLTEQEAQSLAEGLAQCPKLQVLNLNNSRNLQNAGIKAIASSLINCTNLQELYLNNCEIDMEGAIALSLHVGSYQNILILSLRTNNIGSHGAQALIDCLQSCTRLKKLILRNNNIGEVVSTNCPFLLEKYNY